MSDLPAPLPAAPEPDPWASLRAFTAARIALGRIGTSVPLREALAFKLAHAHTRDAVYSTLAIDELLAGLYGLQLPVCPVRSQAATRQEYLQRPDLGRRLDQASAALLSQQAADEQDVAIVIADGLSAAAINSFGGFSPFATTTAAKSVAYKLAMACCMAIMLSEFK